MSKRKKERERRRKHTSPNQTLKVNKKVANDKRIAGLFNLSRRAIKAFIIIIAISLSACMAGRINWTTHPDYNFSPTSPSSVMVYNRFLPTKKFVIIGHLTITEMALTSMKMSIVKLKKITARMGGNAVLISGTQIAWRRYSQAVTTGSANIYNYGYATWRTRTRGYSMNVPVAIFHYCYAIRFLDYVKPVLKPQIRTRITATVESVNWDTREVSVSFGVAHPMFFRAISLDSVLPDLGIRTALVYYSDGSITLEFEQGGILNKTLFEAIFKEVL